MIHTAAYVFAQILGLFVSARQAEEKSVATTMDGKTVKSEIDQDGTLIPFCLHAAKVKIEKTAEETQTTPAEVEQPTPKGNAGVEPGAGMAPSKHQMSFYNKKRSMPAEIAAEWQRLENLPQRGANKNALKREFREEACALEGNSWDSAFFKKFKTISDVSKEGKEHRWVPWIRIVEYYGAKLAAELAANRSILSRPIEGIDHTTTKLEWPDTHEWKLSEEKGSQTKVHTDTTQIGTTDASAEQKKQFEDDFQKGANFSRVSRNKPQPKEKTPHEKTVQEMKAAHRMWDDHKKQCMAVLEKAQASVEQGVLGPKMVADVAAMMKKGNEADESIVRQEVVEKNGKVFNEGDMATINPLIEILKDQKAQTKTLMGEIENITG